MTDTEIKICGLSTPETIAAAVNSGVTHIGFVSFEKSPRHVSVEQAAELRKLIPETVKLVLLTVDMDVKILSDMMRIVRPDAVQFHGVESPDYLSLVRNNSKVEIWKAIGVRDVFDLESSGRFKEVAHKVLFDAAPRTLPGGNGLKMDWSLLKTHKHVMPWGLAGGLDAGNVAEAIAETGAPLVDTSTGVESARGVKDIDKISAFCKAVRNAN